jgi:hypothetical protein
MSTSETLATSALAAGQDPRRLADELAGWTNAASIPALEELISAWIRDMPDDALTWMTENDAVLTNMMRLRAARSLATSDVETAARVTSRVPAASRSVWIAEVAVAQAASDLNRALATAAELRGSSDYDGAYQRILRAGAASDPTAVARMLGNPPVNAALAGHVARAWAVRDPLAALEWAMKLEDTNLSVATTAFVAGMWSRSQAAAAEEWAVTLPQGRLRDKVWESLRKENARR